MNYVTKKNIVLIVLAALFVTGVFFVTEYRNKNIEKSLYKAENSDIIATSSTVSDENIAENNTDSDKDGLQDWEEVLWGTDPYTADTDVDGTSDGAEVVAGRNPLVKKTKTADDSFAALAKKASANATSSAEKLTLTDEFGRDVFSRYMELRQAGLAKDKAGQQELINELLSNSKYVSTPKVYSDKDLILKIGSSKAALGQYASEIRLAFKQNSIESRNEGMIVKESLQKDDPTILKELDPIIASYKRILAGLMATPAPQKLFLSHKALVNAISDVIFVNESFAKASVDPVIALQGVGRFQIATQSLYSAIKAIQDYMISSGVEFSLQ